MQGTRWPTFTITSAYFMTHDTASPVAAMLTTTSHVRAENPVSHTSRHKARIRATQNMGFNALITKAVPAANGHASAPSRDNVGGGVEALWGWKYAVMEVSRESRCSVLSPSVEPVVLPLWLLCEVDRTKRRLQATPHLQGRHTCREEQGGSKDNGISWYSSKEPMDGAARPVMMIGLLRLCIR